MKLIAKIYETVSNAWYRMRLKNDNFTIITNTCIAGVMYHKLGKQFLSPTINLWMYDEDFYKFVHNMDHYLSQPLRFVKDEDVDYPTALCDDVMIYFNHYHTEDEANTKWIERVKRINNENLFIICADRPNTRTITHEDIIGLKDIPCKGRAVFSIHQYDDVDYIIPYRQDPSGEDYSAIYMNDRTKFTRRWLWESAFDWVHWLNTGEVKLRK